MRKACVSLVAAIFPVIPLTGSAASMANADIVDTDGEVIGKPTLRVHAVLNAVAHPRRGYVLDSALR